MTVHAPPAEHQHCYRKATRSLSHPGPNLRPRPDLTCGHSDTGGSLCAECAPHDAESAHPPLRPSWCNAAEQEPLMHRNAHDDDDDDDDGRTTEHRATGAHHEASSSCIQLQLLEVSPGRPPPQLHLQGHLRVHVRQREGFEQAGSGSMEARGLQGGTVQARHGSESAPPAGRRTPCATSASQPPARISPQPYPYPTVCHPACVCLRRLEPRIQQLCLAGVRRQWRRREWGHLLQMRLGHLEDQFVVDLHDDRSNRRSEVCRH
jgi:hypothetical protein